MTEILIPDAQNNNTDGLTSSVVAEEKDMDNSTSTTTAMKMKIESASMNYDEDVTLEDRPARGEVWFWYLYGLCSYLVNTVLIPIVFPLIIAQIVELPSKPAQGWTMSYRGLACSRTEMEHYERLAHGAINLGNSTISPLKWTSVSWAIGLIIAFPLLAYISTHLDHGRNQQIIAAAATAIGGFFCLPTGLFRTSMIFPLYIAAIAIAETIATASHTRHFGLMIRGVTGPILQKRQFVMRRGVSSWFSLCASAASCLGAAIISAFAYRMLRHGDIYNSLWIVSIYSGLMWLVGLSQTYTMRSATATTSISPSSTTSHFLSIFYYPHAIGSLISVFLSSFTTMCIFTGGLLYLVGELCLKPVFLLYFWLIYFIFPFFSLPFLQPFQHLIKANAVKMKLLGFLLSILTSGFGFYFKQENWHTQNILVFAAIQGTSSGILHAFGRVLLLDCSPPGKEGAFSVWFSWMRAAGSCVGFAVASAIPGNLTTSFSIAFCTAVVAILGLIFGNVSDFGGAITAGHVVISEESNDKGTPKHDLDTEENGTPTPRHDLVTSIHIRENVAEATP